MKARLICYKLLLSGPDHGHNIRRAITFGGALPPKTISLFIQI